MKIINAEQTILLTLLYYFDLNFTDQTVAFPFKILTCHWPSAVTLVMCVYNSFIVMCGLLLFIIIIKINVAIILKPYPSQSILLLTIYDLTGILADPKCTNHSVRDSIFPHCTLAGTLRLTMKHILFN